MLKESVNFYLIPALPVSGGHVAFTPVQYPAGSQTERDDLHKRVAVYEEH